MDEELLKRNTDCIYFLASPLTCKKGLECKYRHSEIARLNPRECWYWLSTGCFNLACAFRHPPLVHIEEAVEPDPSSVPASKTNIPCFYYFNSRCNKGDQCAFLHTMEAEPPQEIKALKVAENSELQSGKSNLAGTNFGAAPPNNGHLNPSNITTTTMEDLGVKNDIPKQVAVKDLSEPCSSMVSVEEEEEISLPLVACENQSSEELAYEEVEEEEIYSDGIEGEIIRKEERWESSPGFDVLVDGEEAVNLEFDEDGREYISCCDIESSVEYNLIPNNPPDMDRRYASEVYYQHEGNFGNFHLRARPTTHESGLDDRNGLDLRHRLSRDSFIEDQSYSGRLLGRIGVSHRRRHKRTAPEGMFLAEAPVKNKIFADRGRRNGTPRNLKQHKEGKRSKRPRLMSEISSETRPPGKSNAGPAAFSGPKSLAQIKEEKRKVRDKSGFEGPRPLSKILNEKGKF